jgi:cytidine deaminase
VKREITEKVRAKALESGSRFRVAAMGLSKKGNVIACKNNVSRFPRHGGGIHAEENLIKSTGGRIHTLVLGRVGRSGKFRPINPCSKCRKMINKYNIKLETINGE